MMLTRELEKEGMQVKQSDEGQVEREHSYFPHIRV